MDGSFVRSIGSNDDESLSRYGRRLFLDAFTALLLVGPNCPRECHHSASTVAIGGSGWRWLRAWVVRDKHFADGLGSRFHSLYQVELELWLHRQVRWSATSSRLAQIKAVDDSLRIDEARYRHQRGSASYVYRAG